MMSMTMAEKVLARASGRKSVSAGEYTAPPAQGPMMAEICGTTPEATELR